MAATAAILLPRRPERMRVPLPSTETGVKREVQPGVWLDSRRALWLESERIVVLADLHWGYALSHRARGSLLPAWGDESIASRLQALIAEYRPEEMVWLGDVVHAAEGGPLAEEFVANSNARITVLAGNHDRRWNGAAAEHAQRGRYFLHHGDRPRRIPSGCVEVIGHHHPAVHWHDGAGGSLKLPALVASAERLVLPAFSPWAAGAGCDALRSSGSTVWAITPRRIFILAPTQHPAVA